MATECEEKTAPFARTYGDVILTLENVLIPWQKLTPTPSSVDGLESNLEMDLRVLGCELIQTSGILLKLPQVAMATGQVLFQRFYCSKSFVKHNMEVIAMSCINLASKIEEAPRRMRDVINVFHHIKQLRSGKTITPLVLNQDYINLKNQVIKGERRVLKELGFCCHVKHPHKIIVMYLQVLELEENQKLVQHAWNYMNDSFRTDIHVRFKPETVACACIYLAARQLLVPLPNTPHWFELFDAQEEDLRKIARSILELYEREKPNADKLEQRINELKKVHIEAKKKAKGTLDGTGTPNSRANSPAQIELSPLTAIKKLKAEHDRNSDHSSAGFNRHSRSRSRSRNRSPTNSRSYHSSSRSLSRSLSRSPHHKRSRYRTETKKNKSKSKSSKYDNYDKYDKRADRYEDYNDKYKSSDKYSSRKDDYYDMKHAPTYKHSFKRRSVSYSPSPRRSYSPSPDRKSRKKKDRYRSRSRSYDRHIKKSKKHSSNGHRERSRSRDRHRR